ncbi:MAG: PIG-L family deacetylase [Phycisphaerae bacterium]|nr:PIG-L family deacetylase [Phycisphaerae bacterium]
MNGAVIVAHPDDEIIWCGGMMSARSDVRWTVLTLCRADDPDRAPKFHALCARRGVHGIMSDLDDGDPLQPIDVRHDVGGRIVDLLPSGRWDLCLTHGRNGEYGHPRHKDVHRAVLQLAKAGTLACGELWTFAYECQTPSGQCAPADWGDHVVELTPEQLQEKRRIIRDEYGFPPGSFEETACMSPESFFQIDLDVMRFLEKPPQIPRI